MFGCGWLFRDGYLMMFVIVRSMYSYFVCVVCFGWFCYCVVVVCFVMSVGW